MEFKDLKGKEALTAEFIMLLILIIVSVPFIIFFSLKYPPLKTPTILPFVNLWQFLKLDFLY